MLNRQMKTPKFAKIIQFTQTSAVLLLAGVFVISGSFTQFVRADSITDQISALERANTANREAVTQLEQQAVSYEDAINQLTAQISQVQTKISYNEGVIVDLNSQITVAEVELEKQKMLLGKNIRAMYLEGEISTLEMLASSNDLSDFLNKQEYRSAVQDKIKLTLDKIKELKLQLKTQKEGVEKLLAEQTAQRTQLANAKAKQDELLAYNQGQRDAYNASTLRNSAKIADLIEQQRRANQNIGLGGYYFLRFPGNVNGHDVGNNDYPYRDAGFSMQLGPCSHDDSWPDAPDEWGYCTRQCVSYTAWAVKRSGRAAPMYYGNAKDWVYNAGPEVGVYRDPQPGDVAISTAGTWGHAMYVESVEGNRIFVSQYNSGLNGEYSTQWRSFR